MTPEKRRLKSLQEMARRRGCQLHCLWDDEHIDGGIDENGDMILVFWMYVPDAEGLLYPEHIAFDDMDEVESDLLARPPLR